MTSKAFFLLIIILKGSKLEHGHQDIKNLSTGCIEIQIDVIKNIVKIKIPKKMQISDYVIY